MSVVKIEVGGNIGVTLVAEYEVRTLSANHIPNGPVQVKASCTL